MSIILFSVGKSATNRPADVRVIQALLNEQFIPGASTILKVDGKSGPKTIHRIEQFQKSALKFAFPDGRVDPNGRTFSGLTKRVMGRQISPASSLTLSDRGLTMLKKREALSLKPYDDQTGTEISAWISGATIGYGHLISQGDWKKIAHGITSTQAESLLMEDLTPFVKTVQRGVTAKINQPQFDALVIFCFNVGRDAFLNSTVLRLVNDPTAVSSYPNLEAAWMAWSKSQGKQMQGLINRRKSEWALYSRGVY
jgi:lysozyme